MTDNGPQQERYNAGMRGNKSTIYEGGIRSPFFAQWPGHLKPGGSSDRIAAHVDARKSHQHHRDDPRSVG